MTFSHPTHTKDGGSHSKIKRYSYGMNAMETKAGLHQCEGCHDQEKSSAAWGLDDRRGIPTEKNDSEYFVQVYSRRDV